MKFSILLPLIFATSAQAVEVQIDCALEDVFCTEEFQEIGGKSATIEDAIRALPLHVKRNWTLKRGNNIPKGPPIVGNNGPHGHKVGPESMSATPEQPRVFVWDELTGFTASWNSGNTQHGGWDRIDIYDFDFVNKRHALKTWFPANGKMLLGGDFVDNSGAACTSCHGPGMRPIFPMYPDWPQFYGEFNDELAGYPRGITPIRLDLGVMGNKVQPIEREQFYVPFLNAEAKTNARYSVLYDAKPTRGRPEINNLYPFRPSNEATGAFSNVSRAFANRPNLRFGILYNRLTALVAFEKIKQNPLFKKYADILLYGLADCNWDFVAGESQGDRAKILGKIVEDARLLGMTDLNLRGVRFAAADLTETERANLEKAGLVVVENGVKVYYRHRNFADAGYQQIPYEDLLRLLNLDIRDIDIRFKYDSGLKVERGFSVYDPKAWYNTDSAMDIGYLRTTHTQNPKCAARDSKRRLIEKDCRFTYNGDYTEGMRYFNSYFDGSSTMNELLVAAMLQYLTDPNSDFSNEPELDAIRTNLRVNIKDAQPFFETLMGKYENYEDRLVRDTVFFNKMDHIGPWVQLPYPRDLESIQNRETFWGARAQRRHNQWANLQDRKDKKPTAVAGNLCWSTHASMAKRYLK